MSRKSAWAQQWPILTTTRVRSRHIVHTFAGELEVLGHLVVRLLVGWTLGLAGQHIFYIYERSWQVARPNPFTQWDAAHYLRIAAHGYDVHLTPFFPLYPLLVRWLHGASFGFLGYDVSGVLMSVAALFAAVIVTHLFLSELLDRDSARFGVLLLIWSPASVFLLANYNVSLLVLLMSCVSLFLLRGNYYAASIAASLASASHPLGLSAVVAIGVAVVAKREWRKLLPCLAISVSGFAAYCFYLTLKFSSPLEFQTQQRFFGKRFTLPFESLWTSFFRVFRENLDPAGASGMQFVFQFEMVTAFIAIVSIAYLVVRLWRNSTPHIPVWLVAMAMYQVFVAATLSAVPVFHFPLTGGGVRTVALQVPVSYSRWFFTSVGFLTVASVVTRRSPRLRQSILLASAAFAIFLQTMFVAGLRYF